jgi:uncharacterized protein (TIGR00730 family)
MKDFKSQDTWMVFKIMGEFVEGFETLRRLGPAVSIFGGARFPQDAPEYALAREIAGRLARAGYGIITGGGPGCMEAANRGALEAGARSVGLGIKLPFEQGMNHYATTKLDFDYFFARKVMFIRYAQAYICLPGGYGTLDEVFEALTLIQTAKIRNFPVILVGRKFWSGLLHWIDTTLISLGTISPDDRKIYTVVDTAEEVLSVILKSRDRARRNARHRRVARGVGETRPPIETREDTGPREQSSNGDDKLEFAGDVEKIAEKAAILAVTKAVQSVKLPPRAGTLANVRRPRQRRRRA